LATHVSGSIAIVITSNIAHVCFSCLRHDYNQGYMIGASINGKGTFPIMSSLLIKTNATVMIGHYETLLCRPKIKCFETKFMQALSYTF
jgi:hypothetical protein